MFLEIQIPAFDYYSWVVLPLLIFISRLCDVTLNTLRHVLSTKGHKKISPVLGFFEVLIWLIVIAQVMKNLNNVACYLAWASGFAAGNYVGLIIEERLALGLQVMRIITNQNCDELVEALKKENHGITVVEGQGAKGPIKLIFTIVKRDSIPSLIKMVDLFNPGAFYSIEDVRNSNQGVFTDKENKISIIKNIFNKNA